MRQIWCWIWTRRRKRYNLNYWKSISHPIVIVRVRSIRTSTTRYSMFFFVMSRMDRMWLIFPNKYFRGIQQWKERQFWMNGFRYERGAHRSFAGPQFESRSRKGTRGKKRLLMNIWITVWVVILLQLWFKIRGYLFSEDVFWWRIIQSYTQKRKYPWWESFSLHLLTVARCQ